MSGKCVKCEKGFPYNAYKMKCGTCKGQYHLECVKFTREVYLFHKENRKIWTCDGCFKVNRKSISSGNSIDGSPTPSVKDDGDADIIIALIISFRQEVRANNRSLSSKLEENAKEIKDLKEHLNTYSENIKENTAAISAIRVDLTSIEVKHDELQVQNTELKGYIKRLEDRLLDSEQNALIKTVEISGIPISPGFSVTECVLSVGDAIKFDMNESMIDNCFRRRLLTGSTQPGVISLTFNRQQEKDKFVSLARKKRDLSIRDIGIIEGEHNRIYVNESLTFVKRQILKQAKIFKRNHNFKFVWVRNGRILMKKDEESIPVDIKKIEDFDELISKNGQPSH
ncbi:hypothetical protein GE061_000063 [Apolygus lucorum]|uniref:FP protein C-terminal domain-containing protein n=1 Tax=Apolygus lucorum TaxID=248454 RepID=A0A6A4KNL8_APOLU|nr:hypothetical protein GE061_000063 [Apolygus lucorum]